MEYASALETARIAARENDFDALLLVVDGHRIHVHVDHRAIHDRRNSLDQKRQRQRRLPGTHYVASPRDAHLPWGTGCDSSRSGSPRESPADERRIPRLGARFPRENRLRGGSAGERAKEGGTAGGSKSGRSVARTDTVASGSMRMCLGSSRREAKAGAWQPG